MIFQRHYVSMDDRQVHVVHAGRGPALLMLHPLPLWSMSLDPLARQLADRFTVIAPDLAGYGLTDRLGKDSPSVDDYAADLARLVDRLGLQSFFLYACEYTAAIAAALAALRAGQVRAVALEDPIRLSEPELRSLIEGGLPDFAAEPSGGHLLRMWDAARMRYMFQPSHEPHLANRLDRDMATPVELNEVAKAYMRAGPRYAEGILASVRRDWAADLQRLQVPTLLVVHERIDDSRLPRATGNFEVRRIPHDPQARAEALKAFLAPLQAADGPTITGDASRSTGGADFSRHFIRVPGGHLHARVNLGGAGRPVLALHDPAGSHELVLSFTRGLLGSRPVIALDMPGNGESDNTLGPGEITSEAYARAVLEAVDALGFDEIDVIGRYSGGPIGMEMSFQRPALVKHLVQAAIELYDPADVTDVLRNYMPDISPTRDGSHLVLSWYNMKNQALFWPWFRQSRQGIIWGEPQLSPTLIQQRVLDLARIGNLYYDAYAAMWTYPMEERLPKLKVPTLLCAPRWDPIYAGLERAAKIAPPTCRVETLPDAFHDWAASFARFFDRS